MIEAIIFDMDGVIVDTEFLEFCLLKKFIHRLNDGVILFSDDELSVLAGKSYQDLYTTISFFTGNKYTIEEIEVLYSDFIEKEFSSIDYLTIFRRDLIKIIDFCTNNKIKLAVASSSRKTHIEDVLTACKIIEYFDFIVSGEQFKVSKPDPEIYHYTINKLGVDIGKIVAIEDSFSGILSATRAGLKVIAYEEIRLPIDQSYADYIAKDMLNVYEIIKCLCRDDFEKSC